MKILIGADIVPTISNQIYFESGQMEQLVDEGLREVLCAANYRIFNLEVPLTDKQTPIKKCGPNLIASAKSVTGIKQLGIDFLTLANNHILDQDEQGLWSTTEQLDRAGIAYAGVGHTPKEAAKPYVVKIDNKKIGVYCCAEHEFSIVNEKQSGANPFAPMESLNHIADLKQQCDYLICLYHGGKEHYQYPSPNLQKICRKIVENGADLVVCQHSHCIGCEEKYGESTIVYGQGNFLFDYSDSEYWQTAILIRIDLDTKSIEYIPIQKNKNGVKLAEHDCAKNILESMRHRSDQICQEGFVERNYSEFAKTMVKHYVVIDSCWNSFLPFRIINKICGHRLSAYMAERRIKKHGKIYLNQYECEAHRELIINGLKNF